MPQPIAAKTPEGSGTVNRNAQRRHDALAGRGSARAGLARVEWPGNGSCRVDRLVTRRHDQKRVRLPEGERNHRPGVRRRMAVRMTCLRRAAVAALVAATACLLASCGQAKPWWDRWQSFTCGPPALMLLDGQLKGLGSCAGFGGFYNLTLRVGQQIDLHMTELGSGPSGSQMVPIMPLLRSSRPSIVLLGAISPDRAAGTYQAVRTGSAALYSQVRCLALHGQARETTGSNCLVIRVTVIH